MNRKELTAVIIDDEANAISALQRMLRKYCPDVNVLASEQDPLSGVEQVKKTQPDILFLDIAMPRMDGFNVLQKLPDTEVNVIFTTAYDEYAIQAFKEEAVDYLLKPIDKDELMQAVSRVQKLLASKLTESRILELFNRFQQLKDPLHSIGLPTMEGLHFIKTSDICYCKSDGNYTEIHLKNKEKILISRQLLFMEEKLNSAQFVRVHRSYIVNLECIKKYLRGKGGSLVLENGEIIPVSGSRKDKLLGRIN